MKHIILMLNQVVKNSQKQTDENSKPEDIEQNWEATLINKVFKKILVN